MGELAIRRSREFSLTRYQGVSKGAKAQGSASAKGAERSTVTVSETLRQLMSRVSQAEGHIRESRRTLQTGEGVLAEVGDSLERMARLAQASARGETADRSALQRELEDLAADIDRMIRGALAGETPLFLDEDLGLEDGAEALLYAVLGEASGAGESQPLPDWLVRGLAEQKLMPDQLLTALGLDKNVTGPELLAAITSLSLENSSAADRLAALYLGAVIAGDGGSALEGLEQLMERLSQGVPLDEAIAELTNGEFAGLADFQTQFSDGTAPGLEDFLVNLFLTDSPSLEFGVSPLLSLLEGMQGANLDLMMGLLTVLQNSETAQSQPDQARSGAPAAGQTEYTGQPSLSVQTMGPVQVMGKDLSGVTYDETANVLTVSGDQSVTIAGTGREGPSVVLAGSGGVTVRGVTLPLLTVTAPQTRVFTAAESTVGEIRLSDETVLTLNGRGLLCLGLLRGGASSLVRLTGGAVIVSGEEGETSSSPAVPLVVEGAASLAVRSAAVHSPEGRALEPFDIVWKTLLPGWHHITSMELDGKQAKMRLINGEPARLWLAKGDQGCPIHTLVLRGRDELGRLRTRYAYLLWNQRAGAFEELSMYPNPFAVTGGEAGRDWIYEEESHTLRILTGQVTAVAGGSGMDANQAPFSGRIALADSIGAVELALGGVVCRVPWGRAFDLGRGNRVTLILQEGSSNVFESGAGCAGVSLGEGTSLTIDCGRRQSGGGPAVLTASGRGGGAGIGRDSGALRDRSSQILIRGGEITAEGSGGGAGIGAGRQGAIGTITILGGTVVSTGGTGGGAGIGGALGAPAGDISIRGGTVTASALFHAAAIGAGVQGECGDVLITGTARIVKALGGDPGADIGACLFGGCGEVRVSGGADIGGASLRPRTGVALRMGEDTLTLPQFRLSARSLQLDQLSVGTREQARQAETILDVDRRWVARIQGAYSALYSRLNGSAIRGVRQYIDAAEGVLRDTGAAGALLEDMSHSIRLQPDQALRTHTGRGARDVGELLE